MSMPINVYFVKGNDIVGMGVGNLGFAPDLAFAMDSIFDAWSMALGYYDLTPEDWRSIESFRRRNAHFFTTREELLEYEFVLLGKIQKVVSRELVHRLIRGNLTSKEFGSMLEDAAFDVPADVWQVIMQRAEAKKL